MHRDTINALLLGLGYEIIFRTTEDRMRSWEKREEQGCLLRVINECALLQKRLMFTA